jgi:hypothetical protein
MIRTCSRAAQFAVAMATPLLLMACASAPELRAPEVPPALRPPADQSLYAEAVAKGVQIYRCAAAEGAAPAWAFVAPEAPLTDRQGNTTGKHYAGPTWEGADGSKVVGAVQARDPGPRSDAIPWLLLSAKSNSGSGVYAATKSIQRVDTTGGQAPASGCSAATLNEMVRVPYTAVYYYYR